MGGGFKAQRRCNAMTLHGLKEMSRVRLEDLRSADSGICKCYLGPFTENNIRKLKMVQRKTLRKVFSDYRIASSLTPVLQPLRRPTLQGHSQRSSRCTTSSIALWTSQQATWHQPYKWKAITWCFWYHALEHSSTIEPSSQTSSKIWNGFPSQ